MKRPRRARSWRTAAAAWLVCVYAEVIIATLRWRFEGLEAAQAALDSEEGVLVLFWHGRIAQAIACRPLLKSKPRAVMISLSRDGGFIAAAAERLGFPTIRGSAGRTDQALAKGGAAAFRGAVKLIRSGGAMLITPDGPRGPREVLPEGVVQIARAARCPVYLLGLAAQPALAFDSWDAARLPLPFARARLVIEGPLDARERPEGGDLQTQCADWQQRLRQVQSRADQLLAGGDR